LEIIKSKRKTIAISVDRNENVIVKAPLRMSNKAINEFIKEHEEWIIKAINRQRKINEEYEKLDRFTYEDINNMASRALEIFPKLVEKYAKNIGVSYGRITIRNQKTRWGSCSAKGNLNFNCLLMEAPDYVRDYVIIHELCHRIHMNHSKEFWSLVRSEMPDYKIAEKWLKTEGKTLMMRAF